jgi:O-antigen/teichoic acid export membrane protein
VWFKLSDKTYFGTIIAVIGAIITIAGNFILIPIAGYFGSSVAALLCYFSMAVICYALGQRYYPIPYTIAKDLGYILVTYGVILLVDTIQLEQRWSNFGFHAIVLIAFCGVIYFIERKGLRAGAD